MEGKATTLRLVVCGFNLRSGHTKECIIGTYWLPAWHSVVRVGIGEVDQVKTPKSGITAAHRSPSEDDGSNVEEVFILQVCNN